MSLLGTVFQQTPLGAGQQGISLLGYNANGAARVSPTTVELSATNPAQVVNLQNLPSGQQIGAIVTVYVDNSAGPIPVEIIYPDTGQNTEIPAYCQGFFPALTNGRIFTVTAPLVGELGATFPVIIQALSFAIPQALYGPFLPNSNTGTLDTPGSAGSWSSLSRTVPDGPGNAVLSYQSLEIDCTQFGGNIAVTGNDLSGNVWTVNQLALTKSEFIIPATASGSGYTITATLPDGGPTTAVIPLRWRAQPVGEQPSYNIPLYFPPLVLTYTSLASGNTLVAILPAVPAKGFFVDTIFITSAGWSQQFNITLTDLGNNQVIYAGVFPNGDIASSSAIGYVSYDRDAALQLTIQNAGAATGTLAVNVRAAYLAASQNG